ncbi:MAG: hypothetical protein GF388_09750 [Candidatus Aegiribacteria sp.]|nr:hypothetical protein [Candidatus Aegiribacteria sp.]MBD3295322.1 hypothetical protein [Candidatus Fermentibacteria bacterium]
MKHLKPILVIAAVLLISIPAYAGNCGGGSSPCGTGCGSSGADHGRNYRGAMMRGGYCGGMTGSEFCSSADGCRMTILPLLAEMDLTEVQWEEIDGILMDASEEMDGAMESADFRNPHMEFLRMFTSEDLTTADLEDFRRRSQLLGEQMAEIHDETVVRIHDVLTSEQLRDLASVVSECEQEISCGGGGCR